MEHFLITGIALIAVAGCISYVTNSFIKNVNFSNRGKAILYVVYIISIITIMLGMLFLYSMLL